jgi:hypothetical protein
MHLWRDCVWSARGIGPHAKLVLLRLGCFVDAAGRGCSMSYRQIAEDCEIHEVTAKKVVAKLQDLWLDIHARQGRHVPGKGRENLYDVLAPASVMRAVLERKASKAASGVAHNYPGAGSGVAQRYTNTVKTDYHSEGDTPLPKRESLKGGRSSNSNVIDFSSLKWGGRS